ncbi:MHYT domain-containing protein [Streptomyces kaempferi]|uniref:MHYT domain-containing protein n=1 Tax=Streptomyces kaempferi TaxID=333725 RepID=A0ABW3XL99_9ACTN
MARFRARRTKPEWMWLAFGSVALGAGLWGMYLITWLGLDATGTPIRHDGPLTFISGLICVGSTALSLRLADVRRSLQGLFTAGAVMAGGLVCAHTLDLAVLDAHTEVHSSVGEALASALLAAVGTTAMLWLTVAVGPKVMAAGASLVTGAVLCSAQYTYLAAVTMTPGAAAGRGGGLSEPALIVPLAAVLALVVLTVAFNLYITPVRDVYDAQTQLVTPEGPPYLLPDTNRPVEPAPAPPAVAPAGNERPPIEAGPVVKVAG